MARLPTVASRLYGPTCSAAAAATLRRKAAASAIAATTLLTVLLATAPAAAAASTATLSASFQPYTLGRRSTLQFGFALKTESANIPPPLTQVELRYPADVGVYNSEMGLASCEAAALEAGGPRACPANSVMGYGVVHTGVMLGETEIHESAVITVFRAPYRGRHFALLFFAEGRKPVLTDVIFPGLLLSASEPFGGRVSIGVPLVETLPGAPYVSVLRMHATLGPENVTYFKRAGGITFAFRPRGLKLPGRCPRAGFEFAASFAFSDGTRAVAKATVRCPGRRGRARLPAEPAERTGSGPVSRADRSPRRVEHAHGEAAAIRLHR